MKENMDKQVAYLEFINRENSFHHHRYDDDMRQFELLKNGNLRSVEETKKIMDSGEVGHLSDDPVKNMLYLDICHITLCTRFAIEGGTDAEKAYNLPSRQIIPSQQWHVLPTASAKAEYHRICRHKTLNKNRQNYLTFFLSLGIIIPRR